MKKSKIHYLKILPEYFEAQANGTKTYELRINDRDYKVGDSVQLEEVDKDGIVTGQKLAPKKIVYITYGGQYGLMTNFCIMQLQNEHCVNDLIHNGLPMEKKH